MPSPAYRLTLHDQLFVNAVAVHAVPLMKWEDRDAWSEIARDAAPHVNRDHSFLAPIMDAWLAYDRAETALVRETVRIRLIDALVAFWRWRGALALDAVKKGVAA